MNILRIHNPMEGFDYLSEDQMKSLNNLTVTDPMVILILLYGLTNTVLSNN